MSFKLKQEELLARQIVNESEDEVKIDLNQN